LSEDIIKIKDEMRGKDLAIAALSSTLLEKGEENRKSSEMMIEFKNHLLTSDFYNQKFAAMKIDKDKRSDVTVSINI
jgi:hypothetical protein